MKPELLVIADQHAAVNTFPGLVHTARHTTRVVCTRSRRPNPQGAEASKVWRVRGVKSSQGSRTGRCGWITSFLGSISRRHIFSVAASGPQGADPASETLKGTLTAA